MNTKLLFLLKPNDGWMKLQEKSKDMGQLMDIIKINLK